MMIESIILGLWIATGLVWNGDNCSEMLGWLFTMASTAVTIASVMQPGVI